MCELKVNDKTVVLRSRFDTASHVYELRSSVSGQPVSRRLGELFTEEGFVRLRVLEAMVQQALKK